MSTENRELKDEKKRAANPNLFIGIPVPIWLVLIPALSGIVGNRLGHESGKTAGIEKGQTIGIEKGKAAAPDNQISLNKVNGEITKPKNGQPIDVNKDGEFVCEGTIVDLAPGLHLWLAIERNGWIWPKKGDIKADGSGKWHEVLTEDGTSQDPFTVTLFVANDQAQHVIKEWFRVGEESKVFAQLEWIRGINRLDRIDRVCLNRKP